MQVTRDAGWARLGREKLLQMASLDIEFVRAQGDRLFWAGASATRSTLDLVGGFGATLLGHNHPKLVEVANAHFSAGRPMNVQASRRGPAALLRREIKALLARELGLEYEVLLLNTGTEAVEAALKHARLEFGERQHDWHDKIDSQLRQLKRRIEEGLVLEPAFFRQCERVLGVQPIDGFQDLGAALARKNAEALEHPGYLIAVEGGFHGKTLGSLAVTWNPDARTPFVRGEPLVRFLNPAGRTLEEVAEELSFTLYELELDPPRLHRVELSGLLAIICEPIRGEGGVFELEESLVQDIARYRAKHEEIPLIVDEIQSGLGRTGHLLESRARQLAPDYITLGKSLGGGLTKLSALGIRTSRFRSEYSLLHTSTFADDELSSAVGLRALEIIESDHIVERCAELGQQLRRALEEVQRRWPQHVAEVRGKGLMLGLEFADQSSNPSPTIRTLAEEQLLTTVFASHLLHEHDIRVMPTIGRRNVLRLQPSAYLSTAEIPRIAAAFECLCQMLESGDAYTLLRRLLEPDAPATPCQAHAAKVDAPVAEVSSEAKTRVAFVAHFIRPEEMPLWDASLGRFSPSELHALMTRLQGAIEPRIVARRVVRSTTGTCTELSFIGIFMTSEQIERDLRENRGQEIRTQVFAAYRRAREAGCALVGFGGYTSIATMNCTDLVEDQPAVTTGNALTAGISHEAMLRAAEEMGMQLGESAVAICGGTGNIGQVHARLLAGACGTLSLVGRPGSLRRLRAVATDAAVELALLQRAANPGTGRLYQRFEDAYRRADRPSPDDPRLLERVEAELGEPLISVSEELGELRAADVILSASNSAAPIIHPQHLASSRPVLICDIAIPRDVSPEVHEARPNVRVILGGVVALPNDRDFSLPGFPLPKGETFACTAETLVLGLSGVAKDFSRGALTTNQVRQISALAKLHGFKLGSYKSERSY